MKEKGNALADLIDVKPKKAEQDVGNENYSPSVWGLSEVLHEIEENIEVEAQARKKYYKLMSRLSKDDQKIVMGIISDELDHTEKLREMAQRISGIKRGH
ncbi:hypothetical protein FACS1894195_0150 [Bacteroidia bacterium]|nr:hypothetical protein FACS1894195_0150 [Bacteroidia bacterium]